MIDFTGWRASTYSGTQGNCVEVGWNKSSYSASQSDCVEAAVSRQVTAVRDTKDRDGGTLAFSGRAWGAFLARLKAEGFDR